MLLLVVCLLQLWREMVTAEVSSADMPLAGWRDGARGEPSVVLLFSGRQHIELEDILSSSPTPFPSVPPHTAAIVMASRSLAARLNQGMRAQRAIRSVKHQQQQKPGLVRSLATPVSHGSTTESTTLSNGFTVRLVPFER